MRGGTRFEFVPDNDAEDLGGCPHGVEFRQIDEWCGICERQMVQVTFLYSDGRQLDDCTYQHCPVCNGHRETVIEFWRDDPRLFRSEPVISATEHWLGPRREWLGPIMN